LRADIGANMQAAWGPSFDVSDGSSAGQLGAIVAAVAGELWEVAEETISGIDPDKATGAQQDAVNALTGTVRRPATRSLVFLTVMGAPTTVVNAGFQAKTASTGAVTFTTLTTETIATLPAWTAAGTYNLRDRVTNANRVYYCIQAGVAAGSGGPTTTAQDITDGTVHWRYLGEGTGNVDILAQATVTGPLAAVSGDVTVIVTPVGGVTNPGGVVNVFDATVGTDIESDEDYRVRREEELAGSGGGTAAAIAALIRKIPGVIAVHVFENKTDLTDGNGLPPHSVEALVEGGADQDIINLLGEEVVSGIATYSGGNTVTGTFVDSEGFSETVVFSRPTLVNIYVDVTLKYDNTNSGVNYAGDAAVKSAIAAAGELYTVDLDVFATKVAAAVLGVGGVLDVPRSGSLGGVLISTSPSPTADTTISIDNRSLASFDTSRITVHSSGITP
jgi:uncharacterized phage protein gp47/JayE